MSIKDKRKIAKALLAICVTAVFASGCSLIPKEEEVLKPPLVKPDKETYDTYEVKTGSIVKQVKGQGTFESTKSVYEEFSVTGKVASVNVVAGDKVKKGDVLIQLNVDGLELNVKEKERDLEIAKQALDQAKESRDTQTMKIRLLQLEIAQDKLDDARKQLNGKSLVADMDGVITYIEQLKPGDPVQLQKTYAKIDDPGQLRLAYATSNTGDVSDVQVGMKADVNIKGEKLTGKVVQTPSSAPQTEDKQLADKYTRTLYIQLDKQPAEPPSIGSNADISIITQTKDNVLKIPTQYLGSYLGRNFVKVLDGESIKEVDVEKGLESTSPAEVEIVKGLKEGQKVITPQ